MDPISLVVTALVSGAAAALKPTAEQAVKDAYAGLKELVRRKWNRINVDVLERDPASTTRQDVLREDLEKAQAAADREVLEQAQQVIRAVRQHAPDAAASVGVTLETLHAAGSVKIEDLQAIGSSVKIADIEAGKDLEIKGIKAANPPVRQ